MLRWTGCGGAPAEHWRREQPAAALVLLKQARAARPVRASHSRRRQRALPLAAVVAQAHLLQDTRRGQDTRRRVVIAVDVSGA